MFAKFVWVTGVLDLLLGFGVALPALLDPSQGDFVANVTLGAFLLFAGAALMWSAQDVPVRAPIIFWQGLVRFCAVVATLYAVGSGIAGTEMLGVVLFDGVICSVYFVGTCKVTGASPVRLLMGQTP